jgi:hypothetical protein
MCSKLDILPPHFFGFLFHFYLFFLRWKPALLFLLNSFPQMCGARTLVAMSATAGIPLATQGGACRSDRTGYKSPSVPTASVRSRRHPTSLSCRTPLPSPVPAAPHHLLPICVGAPVSRLPCRPSLTTVLDISQMISKPCGGSHDWVQ